MILVDTSIWIEFFKTHDPVMSILKTEMRTQNIVAVECVFGELLQGAKNRRETDIITEYWQNLPKKNESGIWLEAGRLSSENKSFAKGIGLIDAFLIVFAKRHHAKIWSLDKKLLSALDSSEKFHSP